MKRAMLEEISKIDPNADISQIYPEFQLIETSKASFLENIKVSIFIRHIFPVQNIVQLKRESSKVDWRLGSDHLKYEVYQLSREDEDKLKSINKLFGLNFGAYDLIVKPDDELVFLELNPNGQWGWIQERTGLMIREALVDFLSYEKN